jgi:hypothetical protein
VIIEPRVGGRWFERGEDGSMLLGRGVGLGAAKSSGSRWQVNGNFSLTPIRLAKSRCGSSPEGDEMTRVELEHRHLERFGETAAALRAALESPEGWGRSLARFAQLAEAT